ncbi:sensor histidine kinase [Algicella marina]|uniref:C4-dicarboxylate transport sensor protein DctB n=1 Tax=Algicella marina TaxID=2683284 RepID=A0A6P1SZ96_9RHOB|nr:ATP-binding protein [Algicella marina]QHQ34845.1 sensor histidine kinase [Algicella marina]
MQNDGRKQRLIKKKAAGSPWRVRLLVIVLFIAGAATIIFSNSFLTQRFTDTLSKQSQLTAALYSGNMISMLERQALLPLVLARDPVFISALRSQDYTNTSRRLIEFTAEISASSIDLLDLDGRVVASSDRRQIGKSLADQPYYVTSLREAGTGFTVTQSADNDRLLNFQYSRRIQDQQAPLGIIVVRVDLSQLEESWKRRGDTVVVTDSEDNIVLASYPFWRSNTLSSVLAAAPTGNTVFTAFHTPRNSAEENPYIFLNDNLLLRSEIKTGFRGWRLTYFARIDSVRSRVNGILALEIMALALLMAAGLYLGNTRLKRQSRKIAAESEQLRRLNARLSEEIEERQRVERNLEVAEQSLEQASKLAALGQMSAAVSHELNQPLAAMKTYLAGARLLLKQDRADETISSFHRIDDLIERMGAITRQLKSFARKGSDEPIEVDLRDAVDGSLAMMSPQLRGSRVEIKKILPPHPVMVSADPVRLDQIIVNLLRNAIEAVDGEPEPWIEILVTKGHMTRLTVRDNGTGLEDPDALFEPFYTTKRPGEGVGLGLAISAGIASELGGRLTARNAEPKGAIFELQMPSRSSIATKAAE